jgi:hypothetical protein
MKWSRLPWPLWVVYPHVASFWAMGRERQRSHVGFIGDRLKQENGVIHQAGDLLLRLLLWWAMFLPLGACWSVDSNTVFVDAHDVPCSKLAEQY